MTQNVDFTVTGHLPPSQKKKVNANIGINQFKVQIIFIEAEEWKIKTIQDKVSILWQNQYLTSSKMISELNQYMRYGNKC